MNDAALLNLSNRMNNDFYVGVIGSVRCGKSTFINKFFELKVLPYIKDDFVKNKIIDELPQTAEGKQITTVEPKFVPSQPLNINVNSDWNFNIRVIDCVGEVIPNAIGYLDNGNPRYVKTPWQDEPIPFIDAAKLGTEKVIKNHANLAIYITSDGSFGPFKREDYALVEEKLIPLVQMENKPYTIVLNTRNPNGEETLNLIHELEEKYQTSVVAINVKEMDEEACDRILTNALGEFEIKNLDISLPEYFEALGNDIEYKNTIDNSILECIRDYNKIKDVEQIQTKLKETEMFKNVSLKIFDPKLAKVEIEIELHDDAYNKILDELLGDAKESQTKYIEYLYNCKKLMGSYENLSSALEMAKETGYGISIPDAKDMKLLPPTVVKQNGRYGVKLKAVAPAIHLIRVDVESSFTPMVGSEQESQVLIDNLLKDEEKAKEMWNQEFFGRKLYDIVNDGIRAKLYQLPDKSKDKLKAVIDKMTNSSHSGLIAIIV